MRGTMQMMTYPDASHFADSAGGDNADWECVCVVLGMGQADREIVSNIPRHHGH
jgi:hypothetical protein